MINCLPIGHTQHVIRQSQKSLSLAAEWWLNFASSSYLKLNSIPFFMLFLFFSLNNFVPLILDKRFFMLILQKRELVNGRSLSDKKINNILFKWEDKIFSHCLNFIKKKSKVR